MFSAQEILDRHWNGVIPVNPITMAHALGVQVYRSSKEDIMGEFYFFQGRPVILLCPSGNLPTDRYTIAHELGHFAMRHGPRYRNTERDVRIPVPRNPIEREAHRFAAELLMPAEDVRFAVLESSLSTIEEFSRCFQVPDWAIRGHPV